MEIFCFTAFILFSLKIYYTCQHTFYICITKIPYFLHFCQSFFYICLINHYTHGRLIFSCLIFISKKIFTFITPEFFLLHIWLSVSHLPMHIDVYILHFFSFSHAFQTTSPCTAALHLGQFSICDDDHNLSRYLHFRKTQNNYSQKRKKQ